MTAAHVILYVLAGIEVAGLLVKVESIGKRRDPVTSDEAAMHALVSIGFAVVFVLIGTGVIR